MRQCPKEHYNTTFVCQLLAQLQAKCAASDSQALIRLTKPCLCIPIPTSLQNSSVAEQAFLVMGTVHEHTSQLDINPLMFHHGQEYRPVFWNVAALCWGDAQAWQVLQRSTVRLKVLPKYYQNAC